jgi:tRNA nucleotidyltransferase (CCA-adding enzyme)
VTKNKAVLKFAIEIAEMGGTVYEVGGSVRDRILGIKSDDLDIVVCGVPMKEVMRILPGKFDLVGQSFGIIKAEFEGDIVDVALPRFERSTGVGHKDFEILTDPSIKIEEDLARRDFTCNAIACELLTGKYIDPFNGRSDIADSCLRTVGVAKDRFEEDPLRILRAFRFAATKRMWIDPLAVVAMFGVSLESVARERVYAELIKMLSAKESADILYALRMMVVSGKIQEIIPEFAKSVRYDQVNPHHYLTLDEHVFLAVSYAVERGFSVDVRLAALLHDIAKPATMSVGDDGVHHYYKHDEVGGKMAAEILRGLKAAEETVKKISTMVTEHLCPGEDFGTKALRRFSARLGEYTGEAVDLREADYYAHKDGEHAREVMDGIRAKLASFKEVSGFNTSKLALDGHTISAEFGVTGKEIGAIKTMATAAVVDGEVPNEKEALLGYIKLNYKGTK